MNMEKTNKSCYKTMRNLFKSKADLKTFEFIESFAQKNGEQNTISWIRSKNHFPEPIMVIIQNAIKFMIDGK